MKRLWVAALLLLCVCHAGAVPAHQSEPQSEDPQETPPDTTTLLSRHFQTLSDFFTKELPQRLRADEIQQQAKYVWEVQLRPLAQELRTNVLGLFSSFLDLGKTGGMEKD
uniref:Apolipoprotein A2 n=1 Tax=Gallus gallus TaxID=9031 RepID=A0A8V1AEU3_CHICK